MTANDSDLREQVERVFAEHTESTWLTEHGWCSVTTDSEAMIDSLLPLFATRERAAAEKGWAEGVREGYSHADLSADEFRAFEATNPYLAQREESPNAE